MTYQEKIERAKRAVSAVFGDTSVHQETTLDALEEIQSHVEGFIDAIKSDLKNEETKG